MTTEWEPSESDTLAARMFGRVMIGFGSRRPGSTYDFEHLGRRCHLSSLHNSYETLFLFKATDWELRLLLKTTYQHRRIKDVFGDSYTRLNEREDRFPGLGNTIGMLRDHGSDNDAFQFSALEFWLLTFGKVIYHQGVGDQRSFEKDLVALRMDDGYHALAERIKTRRP